VPSGLALQSSFILHELVPLASSSNELDAATTVAERLAPGSVAGSGGGRRESSD
jgi:hypothetical protein